MKINKKSLFLILLASLSILPLITSAYPGEQLCKMVFLVQQTTWWIGGSIVVIGWVIAGILYLTSGGGERMSVAKKALIAAVIGTILVALSPVATSIIIDTIGGGAFSSCA